MNEELQNEDPCWECEGEGKIECRECGGRKPRFVQRFGPTDFSNENFGFRTERTSACRVCYGTGKEPCPSCSEDSEII